jgi:hypothetical protein
MSNNIDFILSNIPDKFEYPMTTSHKFKRDMFVFFDKSEFTDKICLEIGSSIGYKRGF